MHKVTLLTLISLFSHLPLALANDLILSCEDGSYQLRETSYRKSEIIKDSSKSGASDDMILSISNDICKLDVGLRSAEYPLVDFGEAQIKCTKNTRKEYEGMGKAVDEFKFNLFINRFTGETKYKSYYESSHTRSTPSDESYTIRFIRDHTTTWKCKKATKKF